MSGSWGPWPMSPGGEAGESGAVAEQVIEMVGGHELGVGLAVHVHELGEQKLDIAVLDGLADVVGIFGLIWHDQEIYPSGAGSAMARTSA